MKKAAENNYIQRGFSLDPENVAAAAPLPELLSELAQNLVSDIARRDPEHSQELLSGFVSELFLAKASQRLRPRGCTLGHGRSPCRRILWRLWGRGGGNG